MQNACLGFCRLPFPLRVSTRLFLDLYGFPSFPSCPSLFLFGLCPYSPREYVHCVCLYDDPPSPLPSLSLGRVSFCYHLSPPRPCNVFDDHHLCRHHPCNVFDDRRLDHDDSSSPRFYPTPYRVLSLFCPSRGDLRDFRLGQRYHLDSSSPPPPCVFYPLSDFQISHVGDGWRLCRRHVWHLQWRFRDDDDGMTNRSENDHVALQIHLHRRRRPGHVVEIVRIERTALLCPDST